MLKCLSVVLMFAASLVMVGRLSAQEKQIRGPREPGSAVDQLDRAFTNLNLTDAQKSQFAELKKEYGPKLKAAAEKLNLTDEQKKARREAMKTARDAGERGPKAMEAAIAAMKLTTEQKAAMEEMQTLGKEFREKATALLTPEQKEQLQKMRGERGERRAKPQK
jgi:Spy/CpxP family protein refolding chaperone